MLSTLNPTSKPEVHVQTLCMIEHAREAQRQINKLLLVMLVLVRSKRGLQLAALDTADFLYVSANVHGQTLCMIEYARGQRAEGLTACYLGHN